MVAFLHKHKISNDKCGPESRNEDDLRELDGYKMRPLPVQRGIVSVVC